jgi:hypothetical protein
MRRRGGDVCTETSRRVTGGRAAVRPAERGVFVEPIR